MRRAAGVTLSALCPYYHLIINYHKNTDYSHFNSDACLMVTPRKKGERLGLH